MKENMKEIRNETTRLTWVLTLLSILIVLSGMAAIASAEVPSAPIIFHGLVGIDGNYAEPGTVINAFIDGKVCGSVETDAKGHYRKLAVTGNESDDGKTITFKVDGDVAGEAKWNSSTTPLPQELNLGDLPNSPPPEPPSTDDGSNGGGTSGGYIPPATTSTDADADADVQPVSGEIVTSAPTVTPATNETKKLAEKPEAKGLLPGFEAVFAITGLLAVMYLIRRR